jgi:hypothetical protein
MNVNKMVKQIRDRVVAYGEAIKDKQYTIDDMVESYRNGLYEGMRLGLEMRMRMSKK